MRRVALLALLLAAGCGSAPPAGPTFASPGRAPAVTYMTAATPDDAFRAGPPRPGAPIVHELPTVQEARLDNGLRVLLVEKHQFPIVAFRIVVARGAAEAPPGVAAILSSLLTTGTSTRTTYLLNSQLNNYSARRQTHAGFDSVAVSMQVPRANLRPTLLLAADMIREPSFADFDLERARTRHMATLAGIRSSPSESLAQLLPELVYPADHPYRFVPFENDPPAKVTRGDLEGFVKEEFAPDDTTLVVAGDTNLAALMPFVTESFGAWTGHAKPLPAAPGRGAEPHHFVLLDHPGDSQANIGLACAGISMSAPDAEAFAVASTALSKRLWQSLREVGHYTYGARSTYSQQRGAGPFAIKTAVERDRTGDALRAILKEVQQLRNTPLPDAELAAAQEVLVYSVLSRFETASATVNALATLALYGLPLDEYGARIARYRAVKAEDVLRAAKEHIVPESMQIAVVGDAKAIVPQVATLGLGTVEVRALPASTHPALAGPSDTEPDE